jgi:hypothetical protein
MIFRAETHIAPVLSHVGVESDVDSRLVRLRNAAADGPQAANPALVKVGNKRTILPEDYCTDRSLDGETIAGEVERLRSERCKDRLLAHQFTTAPAAARIAQ